jgi:hypothetical protein
MQTRRIAMIVTVVAALTLALIVGLGAAQVAGLEAGSPPRGPASAGVMVHGRIPIQGRLTDAGGSPLNGDYNVTFRIYDDDTDGTVLCQDTQTVSVSNGLFSTAMDGCTSSDIDGTQVYLGIQVESDGEMTPRQPIYSVPYAMSLVPGADFRGTLGGQSMFTVENRSSEWSTAIFGYASATSGETYGVEGRSNSSSGYGGYFRNSNGVALKAAGSGIIQSTASSFVWTSGNDLRKKYSTDTTQFECDLYGGVKVTRGTDPGTKDVMLPVTLPGQLYGQDVTLTGIDVYFKSQGDFDGIGGTFVRRQAKAGSGDTIISDGTDRVCPEAKGCSYHLDLTQNNVLDDEHGAVYIALQLFFGGPSNYVQIGGVRLTLEHD